MSGTVLSIITPCLNGARWIGEAVRSVVDQNDTDVEHLVIDGGSTDGTLDVLAAHPHLRVFRAADRGMYEALNRGLESSSGALIGFLNCDDAYAPGCFAELRQCLRPAQQALAGAAEFFTERGGQRVTTYACTPAEGSVLQRATTGSPAFNAWFFRREVFERIGPFDARYRIAGDREFMLRFALAGLAHASTSRVLYRYRQHADSLTMGGRSNLDRMLEEHLAIGDRYLPDAALARDARQLLASARTRETLDGAVRALRSRRWADGWRYARSGTRYDAAWGFKFAGRALRALSRGGPIPAGAR